MFGNQIVAKLSANGVSMDLVRRVKNPTMLAFVSFVGDEPEYAFFTENVSQHVALSETENDLSNPSHFDMIGGRFDFDGR